MLMRRTLLNPPRTTGGEAAWPSTDPAAPGSPEDGRPPCDSLAAPALAEERRRPLFRPRRGWFRRLERAGSRWAARNLFPWLPGLTLIYDGILRRQLTLSEAEIELPELPQAFDGLRLLLITDVHAGPFVSRHALVRAFRHLAALKPDLILLGGDLTTGRVNEFAANREAFDLLQAPLGVFAVMGNHDYYNKRPDDLLRAVEAAGIPMLQNRSVELQRGGQSLSLAGVDDLLLGRPDLEAALAGTRPPVVLLSHNPDMFFDAARADVALVLAGHTHAGQVRVPGLPVLVRQSRYRLDEGRYRVGRTELVVSRGLGAVGVPIRANCPPEVVLLRLRRAAG
jgi:predicted MPP superfamily phosphohydrolase